MAAGGDGRRRRPRTAAAWSGSRSLPAGRLPRVGAARPDRARRSSVRVSSSSRPRRARLVTAPAPWRSPSRGAASAPGCAPSLSSSSRRLLASSQRRARRPSAVRQQGRGRPPVLRDDGPALLPRAGAGGQHAPLEAQLAAVFQLAQPAQQRGPAGGGRQRRRRPRRPRPPLARAPPAGLSGGIVRTAGSQESGGQRTPAGGDREELDAFQRAGRQHGPHHEPRRRQVVLGHVERQATSQVAEQGPIGAHPGQERLGLHGRSRRLGQHDAHGAASTELHEHRLAQ